MAQQKVILIFNKMTGIYLGLTHGSDDMGVEMDDCCPVNFVYKEAMMDPETQTWQGPYSTGRVVDIVKVPVQITERELNADAEDKITKRYPLTKQLSILSDLIEGMMHTMEVSSEQRERFEGMRGYITHIKKNNMRYKEAYSKSNSYEYMDRKMESEVVDLLLEGGLHEIVGRPTRGSESL